MRDKKVTFLTQAAMIAALYVVLTFVFAPISFGEVQIRIAEMLTVLPIFTPAAVPGLFVGCLIGNITGGAMLPDVIFGSIATLVGAAGTYCLRNTNRFFAVLPPIVANILIVPFVLRYAYGVTIHGTRRAGSWPRPASLAPTGQFTFSRPTKRGIIACRPQAAELPAPKLT